MMARWLVSIKASALLSSLHTPDMFNKKDEKRTAVAEAQDAPVPKKYRLGTVAT